MAPATARVNGRQREKGPCAELFIYSGFFGHYLVAALLVYRGRSVVFLLLVAHSLPFIAPNLPLL
jgi:hypothetical protein